MTTTEAEVAMGQKAPDLKLRTPEGGDIQLSMLWSERPLSLVFLGALDNTLSSENAILWRDTDDVMREAGGEIVAVCGSTPDDANDFRNRWSLPYPLLCDDGSGYSAFGVSGGRPGCFVLDGSGVVRYLHRNEDDLDNPPTWDVVDAVCEITGKTVERPELAILGDVDDLRKVGDGDTYQAVHPRTGLLSYKCGKCANTDYEILDMSSTSGMMSRMVNLQNRRFSVVACRRCTYCELYKTDSGALRNVLDLLVGS